MLTIQAPDGSETASLAPLIVSLAGKLGQQWLFLVLNSSIGRGAGYCQCA